MWCFVCSKKKKYHSALMVSDSNTMVLVCKYSIPITLNSKSHLVTFSLKIFSNSEHQKAPVVSEAIELKANQALIKACLVD